MHQQLLMEFFGTLAFILVVINISTPLSIGLALFVLCWALPEAQGGFNPLVLGIKAAQGSINGSWIPILAVQAAAAAAAVYLSRPGVLTSVIGQWPSA